MTTTITRTRQSVANGLVGSDHRGSRGGVGVLDFGENGTSSASTDPALSSTGGGVYFGSDGVAAGSSGKNRAGRSRRALKTIAARVTRVFRSLPLSKLKIVVGQSRLPYVPYDVCVRYGDAEGTPACFISSGMRRMSRGAQWWMLELERNTP